MVCVCCLSLRFLFLVDRLDSRGIHRHRISEHSELMLIHLDFPKNHRKIIPKRPFSKAKNKKNALRFNQSPLMNKLMTES